MNLRYLTLIGIVLGACGCRTNPQTALLELENRLLEDRIYQLEDQLAKHQRLLAAYTQNPPGTVSSETIAPQSPTPSRSSATPTSPKPTPEPYVPPDVRRGGDFSGRPGSEPPAPPRVHMPTEALPPGQLPGIFRSPQETTPVPPQRPNWPELNSPGSPGSPPSPNPTPLEPARAFSTSSAVGRPIRSPEGIPPTSGRGWPTGSASNRVQAIRILPERTHGYDADGQAGDEGILLAVAPVDTESRLIPAAGALSVVVLDPAISGESARVARWDFTAEEIAALTQSLPPGEPLPLALVWPKEPPQHNRLHVFVRYITADGRKLQADMPLEVDVQGREILRPSASGGPGDFRTVLPPSKSPLASSAPPSVSPVSAAPGAGEASPTESVRQGALQTASPSGRPESGSLSPGARTSSRIPWKPYR